MENVKTSKVTLILGIVGAVLALLSPILGLVPAIIGLVMGLKDKARYGKAGIVMCVIAIVIAVGNAAAGIILMQQMMG